MRPESGGGDYGSKSGGYDQIGYGTLTATLETLSKITQTITFSALLPMKVGDKDIDPGAIASSGSRCFYSSSNPWVAEIINNKIHAVKCGTATITAWQVGDDTYAEAAPISRTITIAAPDSTPVFAGTYFFNVKSTGWAIDIKGASMDDGAGIIQWHSNGGSNQYWTLSLLSGSDYKLINYKSGKTIGVAGNSSTAGALVEQQAYTGSDYQKWTIANYTCDGSFSFINKGNGLSLSVSRASTTEAAAYEVNIYSGDAHQRFAFQIIIPYKIQQTVSFDTLPKMKTGDPDFTLNAKASSGLAVTYISTNPSVAIIVDDKIHITGTGITSIVASQTGDESYDAAFDIAQTLYVAL